MEAVITMDKSGRIVLPASIRKRFKTSRFEFRIMEDKIELKPVIPLESLFGALPDIDIEKIRREHEDENEHF